MTTTTKRGSRGPRKARFLDPVALAELQRTVTGGDLSPEPGLEAENGKSAGLAPSTPPSRT
ncbi:hypothetical protein K1X13_05425 [Nocardioides sp. WL0053]|uniref:Uncharacterized protein n=1 Tax=Nocardioides jiangsuensis TaxID=2866161 RepID=A0ABS7RIB5_9ACTN|nr:hypothetical protein [Nocardioides jiangsuensis]MBY9074259.1 hypothetical protein [Nocardioides jiangsuensis]